jgi:hypothetical protein
MEGQFQMVATSLLALLIQCHGSHFLHLLLLLHSHMLSLHVVLFMDQLVGHLKAHKLGIEVLVWGVVVLVVQ